MHRVERALHRAAVLPADAPGGVRARAAVGEPHVVGEVVALPVVGLDALDAELEDELGLPAPPRLGGRRGEIDRRARPHPPARDERLAARVADVVARAFALGVVRRGRAVQRA
jgi:hypothetical protein